MPELPDVTVYVEALRERVLNRRVERVRVVSPFVVRTYDPPVAEVAGKQVEDVRRVGKRVVLALEGDLFLVIHLMIAGRLAWKPPGAVARGRSTLAALDFAHGALVLTEAASKQRASIHVVRGEEALRALDPGGLEPLEIGPEAFAAALRRERRTLKRALTDPRALSGIGNAYSDEILHRARLSPMQLTTNLDDEETARLHAATQAVLETWTDRLRRERGEGWPTKVTAFRKGMAVHGRHGEPCPDCGTAVQRIVKGETECNYCPRCQTGGRLLADRALSRLLHDDWPDTIDEWEEKMAGAGERKREKK
ncbi:MAG TPA: DNA-formamidopyrimidine glycosylase family protein [Candidatus Thermoplasmatota archaeon]|nr:DNA-formamidopyrimidine glycosylase family protein [Candidatus Thermoplasmatota archaeon]